MMKNAKKIALGLGCILLALGLCLCAVSWLLGAPRQDWSTLDTRDITTESYDVTGSFTALRVESQECDVRLLPADDGKCRVLCTAEEGAETDVRVSNGTLLIQHSAPKSRFHIGIQTLPTEILIYLPAEEYCALSIKSASGDITVEAPFRFTGDVELKALSGDILFTAAAETALTLETTSGGIDVSGTNCASLSMNATSGSIGGSTLRIGEMLSVSTTSGSIRLTDCTAAVLSARNTSGSIKLTDVLCDEADIHNVSGSITLLRCDGERLLLESTSGSISGTLRTEKVFSAKSTSGSVHVPDTASGGVCEARTTSGSIRLDVEQ